MLKTKGSDPLISDSISCRPIYEKSGADEYVIRVIIDGTEEIANLWFTFVSRQSEYFN